MPLAVSSEEKNSRATPDLASRKDCLGFYITGSGFVQATVKISRIRDYINS